MVRSLLIVATPYEQRTRLQSDCIGLGVLICRSFLENIGLFYRALLQKRPIMVRSLLMVATPYEQRTRLQSECIGLGL